MPTAGQELPTLLHAHAPAPAPAPAPVKAHTHTHTHTHTAHSTHPLQDSQSHPCGAAMGAAGASETTEEAGAATKPTDEWYPIYLRQ
jgi:hypothetical protein